MKSDLDYIFQKLRLVYICFLSTYMSSMETDFETKKPKLYEAFEIRGNNFGFAFWFGTNVQSLKAKIKATYPDAFPDDSTLEALDARPDLEVPR
ncbi:putative KxDL motif-containing protein [Helianthus annuus]|nr:putative KxDL motif-containing protein [Helianthus annuus]